jgi:hypothetical protein
MKLLSRMEDPDFASRSRSVFVTNQWQVHAYSLFQKSWLIMALTKNIWYWECGDFFYQMIFWEPAAWNRIKDALNVIASLSLFLIKTHITKTQGLEGL